MFFFFFQAEDGIRDIGVTGVQTCALPIYTILNLLKNNEDFISGQHISEKLNVSRTSVWKYINMLKEEGYLIESVSKKGYRLLKSPDILTENEITPYLNTKYIGNKIIHFHKIGRAHV